MTNSALFWDRIADRYGKSPIRDPNAYHYTLDRIRSYLGAEDRVLEVGCGTASTALLLAPNVGHLKATDISEKMIGIGKTKADAEGIQNLTLEVSGAPEAGAGDDPYDVVLALNLIHLLPDPKGAIAELAKRVKPGGYLITKTPCLSRAKIPLRFRLLLLALPVMQFFGKAPPVKLMSTDEMEAMVKGAGLSILESGDYPAMPPSRFIVARKASD